MATAGPVVTELPAQEVRFLFGTMMDLRMLPSELKHTGNIAQGEFKIVAHFPAIHETNGTEASYLSRHKTFRGGLYATYQDGPYKIDEVNWDATNRAGVHMVTMTKYGQVVEFPTQPSKTMPGSLKLMIQEYVESLKVPGFVIRCSGLGGALEPKKGTTDEYNVILLSGDAKCPKKLANHVPAKYHAEDESIFLAQTGPWCGNAEDYQKPPWIKGPGRKTRAMRSAKKQKNIDLREKRNAEQMTQMGDSFFPVIPNTGGGDSALGSGRGVPQWYGAEEFAAASTARADLPREKRNVLNAVRGNYDPSFSWSSCSWGPYFNRYQAEGSNKFYSVWVWERSPGIYTAMGAYGGLGQNPRLFNVGQTRDLQQAVNMAKKKLQSKQKKGYQTYTAEQMTQMGDSFFPVIPNTGGGDSALGSGRGVPQWYGAESAFDKLANKVAQGYIKKGKSKEEALEIGRKTAYKIGVKKYGKAGMKRKSMEGRMRRKNAETFYAECGDCGRPATHSARGGTMNRCDRCWPGEEFEAPMPFHSPSKGDVDRVLKSIRARHKGIRMKGSPTYLTERKGGSNKYHVFQMTNRGGFNGYGRIGHTMTVFGPMSQQQYQSKLHSKMKKGYKETGY